MGVLSGTLNGFSTASYSLSVALGELTSPVTGFCNGALANSMPLQFARDLAVLEWLFTESTYCFWR